MLPLIIGKVSSEVPVIHLHFFQFSFGTLSLNGSEIGVISMASLDPLCSEYP